MPQKRIPKINIRFDGHIIEHTDSYSFLGLTLHKNLKWNEHVTNICLKVSRSIGIVSKIKYVVPKRILMMLYNTFIMSHFNYCLIIWGHDPKKLFRLQKRALRIVTLSEYNAHTEPIFKTLGILNITDMHNMALLKFYYKVTENQLPLYFKGFDAKPSRELVPYQLRHNLLRTDQTIKQFAKYSVKHKMVDLVNVYIHNFPQLINMIKTHTIQAYTFTYKGYIIERYKYQCTKLHCFTCKHGIYSIP